MLRFLGCVCSENALNVINPKLDDIGPKVESLIAMFSRLDASQIKPTETRLPDTFRNPEIPGHTEELARSIKAVVTAASSAGGLKPSKWAGSESNFLYFSEYGELLDDTWRTRMEQWIPPPALEEGSAVSTGVSASTEMTETASPTEDEFIQDYESDDEVDLNVMQTLIESGGKHYAQQRYAEAARYYRASIDRAKHLSQAKTSSLELEEVTSRLAAAEAEIESGLVQRIFEEAQQAFARADYCEAADMFRNGISRTRKLSLDRRSHLDLKGIQQKSAISFLHLGDLNEAERAFKGMVGQDIIDDESRAYKLHASSGLALVHLCRRDFVMSERWCRQALVGWGRLLGKEHSLYNRSLQLLALIHEVKGDFATASALDILSKDLKSDFDKESDARIENLVTCGLDTASSRVLVSNHYMKCANNLLHDLGMDLQAEELEKDDALLELTGVESDLGLRSKSNISFTVRYLLDQGANANATDSDEEDTALMKASFKGHRDIVQLLCERGADVNAKDKDGYTALHLAVQSGNIALVELLLKQGANMEATAGKFCKTALIEAAFDGWDFIAVILLQTGASVSAVDSRGSTALAYATYYEHEGMAKILLDSGADLESRDVDGETPLFVAASWDKVESVKILLAAGAKIDARNLLGVTPLFWATNKGNRASMELLLDAGANIDMQDDRGWTAAISVLKIIHTNECACNFCSGLVARSALFRVLALRGANLSLRDRQGKSAIDHAREYQGKDRADIIAVLKEASAIEGRPLSRTGL